MNKLMIFVALAIAACSDSNNNTTPPPADAAQSPDATAGIQCFSGTASSNDQLMNACVDEKVVTVIHKMPVLPLLNSDGSLPNLP